ncbi:dermonecrotic toxin domain-containing protein [Pseudomonas putida]
MTSSIPFHLQQMTRTVAKWPLDVPAAHISKMMATQRNDYLQADGQPHDWFVQATEAQREALRLAIEQRQAKRNALHRALQGLKGVNEFCKPLLEQRLAITAPVDEAVYFFQPFKRRPFVQVESAFELSSGLEPQQYEYDPDGKPRKVTLLEAAMHNFTGSDEAGPYSLLTRSKADGTRLVGLAVADFIETCRDLDLGRLYQDHLAAIYDGADKARIDNLSIDTNRDELLVQALIAAMRGRLSSQGLQAVRALCAGNEAPLYDQQPVKCWRLSIFEIPLHEVLVIGPDDALQINPCIVYIPGADDAPLQEYASASAAASALSLRMQQAPLLQLMTRFAPQALQPQLSRRLHQSLFDRPLPPTTPAELAKPNPRLLYQTTLLPTQPWAQLQRAHVKRLKADAATLAVPTAQVDAQALLELLEHSLSVGLDLANVAAMFIPGLNTVMLAIGAAQIMTSVFHGIEAWEHDDKAQAAAQLESVLLNFAVIGAVGGGVALLKSSRFVDSLLRIEPGDGERLWQPDLSAYASPRQLPATAEMNELGQYTHDERHYIRLDGTLYEKAMTPEGQWRISHPSDTQAYRPALRHIGQGVWRATGEQPLDWQPRQLLRRLGMVSESLGEADLDVALRSTGMDDDMLRHTHVAENGAPALLAETLQRLHIDQETSELIHRVRHGLSVAPYKHYAVPSLLELPGWPQDHVLKVFDGPEPWGSSTVYGNVGHPAPQVIELTRSDLELGKLSETVLGQLDEQTTSALLPNVTAPDSRSSALDNRLDEYLNERRDTLFDSLYQSRQRPLSTSAQALKRQFSGLPDRAAEEIVAQTSSTERLRMAAGRIPLRIAEEARVLQARARLDRALLGLYRPTLANADSQRLAAALLAEQPSASPAQLLEAALADRRHAGELIGQQPVRAGYRSPLRLSDGRYGYPLSGRSGWRAWVRTGTIGIEERRLQELYPALERPQRRQLLNQLRQRGNLSEQLRHLQRERNTLEQDLLRWAAQAEGELQEDRELLRQTLLRAARRDDGATLTLQHMTLPSLPTLSASFEHITTLNIQGVGLHTLPVDFLQSFPQLQRLRLSLNPDLQAESLFLALRNAPRLQSLELLHSPLGTLDASAREALARLPRLRELRLADTALVLNDADLQVLTRLPLERLDLRSNSITLDPTLAARFGEMTRLRELNLSHNPLLNPPALSTLHNLQNLSLNECGLLVWPEQLSTLMNRPNYALRNLEMSVNQIEELPAIEQILASAYARNLLTEQSQHWEFHFNNLEPDTAQRLRNVGVGVIEQEQFLPEAQAVDWRANANEARQQLWDAVFEGNANSELRDVIERVGRSAQAQQNQQSLATQVWQLLEAASEDQTLRERLNEVAGEFPPTCGDAGADAFSTLEIELLAYRDSAEAEVPGPYLFRRYQRLFRREQVNVLAARIHAARLARRTAFVAWLDLPAETRLPFPELPALDELDDISLDALEQGGVDDIEIRLALRQALAALLDFPEPSQDMLYRESAHINETTKYNVEQAVLALDEDAAARRAWIAGQPSWRLFIRQRFSSRFAALDERWYRGLEYLDYCLNPANEPIVRLDDRVRETLSEELGDMPVDDSGQLSRVELNSQQYADATNRLASERQAGEEALYTRLTAEQDPNN